MLPLTDTLGYTDAEIRTQLGLALPDGWSFTFDPSREEGAWVWAFLDGDRVVFTEQAIDSKAALHTAYCWLYLYLARQNLTRDARWVRPQTSGEPAARQAGTTTLPPGYPAEPLHEDLDPAMLKAVYEAHKSPSQG